MSDEQEHDEHYFGRGDFEHAYVLLHIVEKCAGHSGKLGALSNAAMTELMAMNEHVRQGAIAAKAQLVEIPDPIEPPVDGADIHTADNPNPQLERRV